MQYPSVKLFEWHWSNRDACHDLLAALPQDSYILARDHPMSEQKQDMWNDPVGTGTRHANEWAMKVASGQVHTPDDRTFFLGINEPDATTGDRNAIDVYTQAFLSRLRVHGLRGGGFNFSTGHPRTVDGTSNSAPDYSVFEQSHRAIVEGHHIGVLHIYGTAAQPLAPGHFDRLRACTWQDVEWVVGEFGIDEHVIGGGEHKGYLASVPSPMGYCEWLDTAIMGINDARIHSYQVFTYDFSHPWASFDIRPGRDALESYQWRHMSQQPSPGPGPTPPTKPTRAYVIAQDGANIRSAPVDGDILTAVPYADEILITGVENIPGWVRVRYGNKEGWMASALIGLHAPEPLPAPSEPTPEPSGDNFRRVLAFVLEHEGGWADDPNDPGGATMKGITIGTFKAWRAKHGQQTPTKDDLRNISDAEVEQIYREWYWLASGSDKLSWPLCLAQMDTAVNAGVGRAVEMLRRSNDNFLAYMGHLIDWYTRIENFEHFGRGWIRRRAAILLEASK